VDRRAFKTTLSGAFGCAKIEKCSGAQWRAENDPEGEVKKYPVVVKGRPIVPAVPEQRSKTAPRSRRDAPVEVDGTVETGGFVRFSYSYTEISSSGPTARVKSRRAAYENGRLVSEQFEGDIDRGHYDRIVGDAQRDFGGQAAFLLRSLFPFLR
jgi:hypothetical protein